MGSRPVSVESLLAQAEAAWAGGDGAAAMALYERAAQVADGAADVRGHAAAVLGLAGGQRYNLSPGLLAVRLHAAYEAVDEPGARARLAAALARSWAYANESRRARPFAVEALHLADELDDPRQQADALDAALATHWGPDDLAQRRDWAVRLDDAAAHLVDPDARLQAQLWSLTVAWEVLDLPRIYRSMHGIELLAAESPRAEFFAATRRLPIELLRQNLQVVPLLLERATSAARRAVIPDADSILHAMRGYGALFAGDEKGCAAEAPAFEEYAVEYGVATVRAEAAMIWLGAGRPDKVAEMIGVFTPAVLSGLPKDSDWLLVLQCALEGALALRDTATSAAALELLAPYAGRSVVNAGAVMWHGVTDDTLARAYALHADPETGAQHRASALATYRRIGAVWWHDRLSADSPDATPPASRTVVVHLHEQPGGLWLAGREGATFVLPRMRGLAYLHALLSRPDTDLPATALAGSVTVEQSPLEVLDEQSRRELGARLRQLDAELAQGNEPELRDEREAIAAYLSAGAALGGRARSTGSHAERARVAVRKAIVAALARIAEADPWLGRHLRDRIRTGSHCRYETDPDHEVQWVLKAPQHRSTVAR